MPEFLFSLNNPVWSILEWVQPSLTQWNWSSNFRTDTYIESDPPPHTHTKQPRHAMIGGKGKCCILKGQSSWSWTLADGHSWTVSLSSTFVGLLWFLAALKLHPTSNVPKKIPPLPKLQAFQKVMNYFGQIWLVDCACACASRWMLRLYVVNMHSNAQPCYLTSASRAVTFFLPLGKMTKTTGLSCHYIYAVVSCKCLLVFTLCQLLPVLKMIVNYDFTI